MDAETYEKKIMDLESQLLEKTLKLQRFIKEFRRYESNIHDEFKDVNISPMHHHSYHMPVQTHHSDSRSNNLDHFRGISDTYDVSNTKDGFRQSGATITTNKTDGRASFSPFPTDTRSLASPTNKLDVPATQMHIAIDEIDEQNINNNSNNSNNSSNSNDPNNSSSKSLNYLGSKLTESNLGNTDAHRRDSNITNTNDIISMTPQQKAKLMQQQHNVAQLSALNAVDDGGAHIRDVSMLTHHADEVRDLDNNGNNNNNANDANDANEADPRRAEKKAKIAQLSITLDESLAIPLTDENKQELASPMDDDIDLSQNNSNADTLTPIVELGAGSPHISSNSKNDGNNNNNKNNTSNSNTSNVTNTNTNYMSVPTNNKKHLNISGNITDTSSVTEVITESDTEPENEEDETRINIDSNRLTPTMTNKRVSNVSIIIIVTIMR